jgi:hypothetical protein
MQVIDLAAIFRAMLIEHSGNCGGIGAPAARRFL